MPLDEDSTLKTAFTCLFAKYKYQKVPLDLAKAWAYFQELMNKVLKDLPFAIVYLDDIFIYSKSYQRTPGPFTASFSQTM